MRERKNFCANWHFHNRTAAELLHKPIPGRSVRLPHSAVELPHSYFEEGTYQREFTYQKVFSADPAWVGKEVFLVFDGAMANAKVYLNGQVVGGHPDGYTPFQIWLGSKLKAGDNLLVVVIDGTENPEIPPFGGTIDYLTYAGIYREVWLEIRPNIAISTMKIETPDALASTKSVVVTLEMEGQIDSSISGSVAVGLFDSARRQIGHATASSLGKKLSLEIRGLEDIVLWDLKSPALYSIEAVLETASGSDKLEAHFGFRTVKFGTDGFYLNGKRLKLRGLNRHQSFPYVGYALPRAAQERDAEIIKHELGCNVVRSSHYPPSTWFLDHCDRIGLLVIEEIPGWQHIGGTAWKAESVRNVERMIRRDWNHASVIMWGVRINESLDDHDFYIETNRVAKSLDITRPTGGIRCIENSELLEDVYTMNDFILGRKNAHGNQRHVPLRDQRQVTGLAHDVPYLVTEYNGHMFPTKNFDQEERQVEHVMRHLEVLNAAYGDPSVAGCIAWCAFDYNTHSDFGSGDMICHHGVMDMFREPKFAAFVYASQIDPSERVVMEPVTFWTRGDRNEGGSIPLVVLTNCDEIEFEFAGKQKRRISPDRGTFPHLPHAPVIIDHRHFSEEELSEWGARWTSCALIGYVNGEPVVRMDLPAKKIPTSLEIVPDRNVLDSEGDCIRVMVRALDQAGRKLPFFFEPIQIEISGAAKLIGPDLISMRGGSAGFWIESVDMEGPIGLTITSRCFGKNGETLLASKVSK